MSVSKSLRYTYEDYARLPDDRRYEVIDGELYLTPALTPYHQLVGRHIQRFIEDHVEKDALGIVLNAPCDVVLSQFDVLQPDIFFISATPDGGGR
jgi:Uma2 family endonuclease